VLRRFARTLADKGYLGRIWGFIDGHFCPFSRPAKRQRVFFSGHKRLHSIGFQTIVTPDGLMSSLVGPFVGKTNGWAMYIASRVPRRSRKMMGLGTPWRRRQLWLYGDPAYYLSFGIIAPFGPRKRISRKK
jgi:hypothetical protein